MKRLLFALCLLLPFSTNSFARVVTLVAHTENGTNLFASLAIGTNEVVEVRSILGPGLDPSFGPTIPFSVTVDKGGEPLAIGARMFLNGTNGFRLPVIVAGPATIRLDNNANVPAFLTLEIKTEAFPPDRTLIIPGDSNGANVIMESSTDLVNWFSATPGTYTNRTNNLFFRIRAERLP